MAASTEKKFIVGSAIALVLAVGASIGVAQARDDTSPDDRAGHHGQKSDHKVDGEGRGPDARGPAGHGLCNAFDHGGLSKDSRAYKALVDAVGGGGKPDSFCDDVADKLGKPERHSDHGRWSEWKEHGRGR